MSDGKRGAHEPEPAEGEPGTRVPAAGADDDTPYDEGAGDQVRPDESDESGRTSGERVHHLPSDMPPGERPER